MLMISQILIIYQSLLKKDSALTNLNSKAKRVVLFRGSKG